MRCDANSLEREERRRPAAEHQEAEARRLLGPGRVGALHRRPPAPPPAPPPARPAPTRPGGGWERKVHGEGRGC